MAGGSGHPLAGVALREGVALLYGYLHDWLAEYATLSALGVKEENMPGAVFARMTEAVGQATTPESVAGGDRASQIAAFVAAAGE